MLLVSYFTEWLEPHRITIQAARRFKLGGATGGRRRTHSTDVYCIVKAYMRDIERNQAPVLVLPKDRRDCVQGPAPTTVETLHFELGRKNQLEHLANLLEKPDYGYYKASASIRASRTLITDEAPVHRE